MILNFYRIGLRSGFFRLSLLSAILLLFGSYATAADYTLNELTVVRIRAVGDCQAAEISDNTVELWFSESISGRAGPNCLDGRRVFVNARHYQMVMA